MKRYSTKITLFLIFFLSFHSLFSFSIHGATQLPQTKEVGDILFGNGYISSNISTPFKSDGTSTYSSYRVPSLTFAGFNSNSRPMFVAFAERRKNGNIETPSSNYYYFADGTKQLFGLKGYNEIDIVARVYDGTSWGPEFVVAGEDTSLLAYTPSGTSQQTYTLNSSSQFMNPTVIFAETSSTASKLFLAYNYYPFDQTQNTRLLNAGRTIIVPLTLSKSTGKLSKEIPTVFDTDSTFSIVGPGAGIKHSNGALIFPATQANIMSFDNGKSWKKQDIPAVKTASSSLTSFLTSESTIIELNSKQIMRNDRGSLSTASSYRIGNLSLSAPQPNAQVAWSGWDALTALPDPKLEGSITRNQNHYYITGSNSLTRRVRMVIRSIPITADTFEEFNTYSNYKILSLFAPMYNLNLAGYTSATSFTDPKTNKTYVAVLIETGDINTSSLLIKFIDTAEITEPNSALFVDQINPESTSFCSTTSTGTSCYNPKYDIGSYYYGL